MLLFINISSLVEYNNSRKCLHGNQNGICAGSIQLPNFLPYFAQMQLTNSLEEYRPSYLFTYKINSHTTPEEDKEKLKQCLAEKKFDEAGSLYFKLAFNGDEDIKAELANKHSNLLELTTPSQNLGKKDKFISSFVLNNKEDDVALDKKSILEQLLNFFVRSIKSDHHDISECFKEDLENVESHSKTSKKARRDVILGCYSKNGMHSLNPDKAPVIDAACLLKIFGFIYLKDNISTDKFPIKSKTNNNNNSSAKNDNDSMLGQLQKIKEKDNTSLLGRIAHSFYELINNGHFKRDNGKYYWHPKEGSL